MNKHEHMAIAAVAALTEAGFLLPEQVTARDISWKIGDMAAKIKHLEEQLLGVAQTIVDTAAHSEDARDAFEEVHDSMALAFVNLGKKMPEVSR